MCLIIVLKRKRKNNIFLFKFNLNNEEAFKKYYFNLNLSIDENEINKYKKIDIKGIKNKINICSI